MMVRIVTSLRDWLKINWPIAVPFVLLALVLHAWFMPGLIAGEDFRTPPFSSFSTLDATAFWPGSFDPTMQGGFSLQAWWPSFPLWALAGVLHRTGFSWALIERVFWLWPCFVLLVAAPYHFFRARGVTPVPAAIGSAVFALNTWTVALVERGHIPAIVAYALMPLVVDRFIAIFDAKRFTPSAAVAFALVTTLQIAYEIRYTYLTAWLCAAILVVFVLRKGSVREIFGRLAAAIAATIACNLYWLVPSVLAPPSLPDYTTLSALVQVSGDLSLLNALALYHPYYHHNVIVGPFEAHSVEPQFLILPALAIFGYFAARKRRLIAAFALVGIVAVVIGSGPNSQLGGIVKAAYMHVPGLKAYRDLTKLMSLIGFIMAFGVALGTQRLLAMARYRRLVLRSALAVAVGVALVGGIMSDAFNPLRLSNFAISEVRPEDSTLQSFIAGAPGTGKVILFPSFIRGVEGTDKHPMLYGGDLGLQTFRGFGALIDRPVTTLDFYKSSIAPKILREIGVKYLVVADDPTGLLYRPFTYNIQRGEALRFFKTRPWLKFDRSIGGHAIFELRDPAVYRPAFYASCPTLMLADARSVPALNGTPLTQGDPALVLAAQQSETAHVAKIPNVVSGVISVGELDPTAARALSITKPSPEQTRQIARLNAELLQARMMERPFQAFAITQDSMTPWQATGSTPFLKSVWNAPDAAAWRVTAQLGLPRVERAIVDEWPLSARLAVNPSAVGAPLLSPNSLAVDFASGANRTASGGYDLATASTIQIVNPFDRTVVADLVLTNLRTKGSWPETLVFEGNGTGRALTVSPASLPWVLTSAAQTTLKALTLRPGANVFTLSIPPSATSQGFSAGAVGLNNVVFSASSEPAARLAVSQTRLRSRDVLSVRSAAQGANYSETRVRLKDGLDVPLTQLASIDLRFKMQSDALAGYLALGFKTDRGQIMEVHEPLAHTAADEDVDVSVGQMDAAAAAAQTDAHAGDFAWIIANAERPRDTSGLSLRYVDLVLNKRADVLLPKPVSVALSSVEITEKSSKSFDGPNDRILSKPDLRKAFVRGSGGRFAIADMTRDPSGLALKLNYSNAEALVPAAIRLGDVVTIRLLDARTVQGRVTSLRNDVVVVTDSTGQQTGVMRSAIESIQHVQSDAQDVTVRIPVDASGMSPDLRFRLSVPQWLTYTVRLGVSSDGSGAVRYIAPSDTLQSDVIYPAIPPKWISQTPMQELAPVVPMGVVIDVNAPAAPVTSWTQMDLDLAQIYAAQTPETLQPRLRFVEFKFRPLPDFTGTLNGILQIANVEVHSGSVAAARGAARTASTVKVDGRALRWRVTPSEDSTAVAVSDTGALGEGPHYVISNSDAASAVLVQRGTPSCSQNASEFVAASTSEILGGKPAAPGLVIGNFNFDSNWHLAIVPPSVSLTGNTIVDYLRARRYFVPRDDQFIVNGGINGWWIDKSGGRPMLLFAPTVFSYAAGVVQLPVLAILLILLVRKRP